MLQVGAAGPAPCKLTPFSLKLSDVAIRPIGTVAIYQLGLGLWLWLWLAYCGWSLGV